MKQYIKHLLLGVMVGTSVVASAAENADSLAALADKAPANAPLNFKAGRALYEAGRNNRARAYLSRGGNDAQPWLALVEFEDYKFDQAAERAQKYLSSRHDASSGEHALASDIVNRASIATTMLDRVEKVQIIDSIVVDKDSFFKAFKISPTTGRVADASVLQKGMRHASPTTVYVSEEGDRMMWGAPDADGVVHIVESSHLADGTWEAPHAVGDNLQLGGNANFPFLLADGVTLYYASDGEGSLGGYDIYITRNDGAKYLNPQNIGMPYNSPMDDYLLAIDDATGAGWWATDRNLIPDALTVYLFVPQELRDNYPVDDTADLIDRARISSIAATQVPGKDYSVVRNAIKDAMAHKSVNHSASYFSLSLPDGRVVRTLDGFHEPEAVELMETYLAEKEDFDRRSAELLAMRARYAKGDKSVAEEIRQEEVEIEQLRVQLAHMLNDVVKAEVRDM